MQWWWWWWWSMSADHKQQSITQQLLLRLLMGKGAKERMKTKVCPLSTPAKFPLPLKCCVFCLIDGVRQTDTLRVLAFPANSIGWTPLWQRQQQHTFVSRLIQPTTTIAVAVQSSTGGERKVERELGAPGNRWIGTKQGCRDNRAISAN